MENTVLILDIKSKSKSKNGYLKFIDIITNLKCKGSISNEEFQMFTKDHRILAYRTSSKIYIVFNYNMSWASYKSFASGTINICHNCNYEEFGGISNGGTILKYLLEIKDLKEKLFSITFGRTDLQIK